MTLACRTAAETLNDLAESSQLAREEGFADGAIMARWRANTYPDVANFDGCGFGKYCFISLRLALLMPRG